MSYIDKLMQAALDDGRPKKIKIQQGFLWVWCGEETTNSVNAQVAAEICKKIGKNNVQVGYSGVYFSLNSEEIAEALPPEYNAALKIDNENRVKHIEAVGEHKRKRQGAIRNAQMNAAKAWDASDLGKEYTRSVEDTKTAWSVSRAFLPTVTPSFLIKGMEVELRD